MKCQSPKSASADVAAGVASGLSLVIPWQIEDQY